jgi:alpha-ribazole phosphatase
VELVLVRHAEPTDETRGRCYGRLDVPLSENGREQSRRLAERLSMEAVAGVVSSPQGRARETATAIAAAHGLRVAVLEELSELDFGELEGRTYDEIAAAYPELYRRWMTEPTTVSFPGGESHADLAARVRGAVSGLRAAYDGQLVVAVTHGGVIRTVLADALGLPAERMFRIAVEPASIARVAWVEGHALVRTVNELTHRQRDVPAAATPTASIDGSR